jgi:membrane-associated phospholipid phosphatase
MPATPPQFDLWLVAYIATLWDRSTTLDLVFEQSVAYGIFGGLWYSAAIFALWIQGALPGQRDVRRRILTISLGSLVAAALTVILTHAVSWPPPSAHPDLASNYLEDFTVNLNATSFPSQSTAVYAAVAAGIYSLRKILGVCVWIGVAMLVALPRIYLGGHYFTDILAGLVVGITGYFIATRLEATVVSRCETAFEYHWSQWQRFLAEGLFFLWILQVANGFSHVVLIAPVITSLWT